MPSKSALPVTLRLGVEALELVKKRAKAQGVKPSMYIRRIVELQVMRDHHVGKGKKAVGDK